MNCLAILLIGLAIVGPVIGNWREKESFMEWLKRKEPSRVFIPNEDLENDPVASVPNCQCSMKYVDSATSGEKLASACQAGYQRCDDTYNDGLACCRKV